jgi:hypothetical protein
MVTRGALGAIVAVGALTVGCVQQPQLDPNASLRFARSLPLHGHALTIHLARATQPDRRPLLVYATGDAGWRGKDVEVYDKLTSWGYAAAGFSSPDYLDHLGRSNTTTPGPLARDYEEIASFAKGSLDLPSDAPIILVGVSRGADLSVIAAGQRVLRDELWGVVAVGLTEEEEYVRWFRRTRGSVAPAPERVPVMVELYEYLPLLGPVPVSVIQSTHDKYLPADHARKLFGPDTKLRRLHAIEAENHSFGAARELLYDAIQESLTWVDRLHTAAGSSGSG